MAHFARVDSNNVVIRVHVLNNEVLMKDGEENEQQGIEFLQNLHKTLSVHTLFWKMETSPPRAYVM